MVSQFASFQMAKAMSPPRGVFLVSPSPEALV